MNGTKDPLAHGSAAQIRGCTGAVGAYHAVYSCCKFFHSRIMNSASTDLLWDQRTSAPGPSFEQTHGVFQSLFEQSSDAIWLYDPKTIVLLDCNPAAVKLMGAENKEQFLRTRACN